MYINQSNKNQNQLNRGREAQIRWMWIWSAENRMRGTDRLKWTKKQSSRGFSKWVRVGFYFSRKWVFLMQSRIRQLHRFYVQDSAIPLFTTNCIFHVD